MKIKIFITTCILLFLTGYSKAQCSFTLTHDSKDATCGNNGAIQAIVAYPAGSSEADFNGFTFYLEESANPGVPVTSISNIDPYIGQLAPGSYNLIAKGLCVSSGEVIETVTGITVSSVTVNPFTVTYEGYGSPSLPSYPTGSLKFKISGTDISSKFTVTITNAPSAYTGPTQFIVGSGDITIEKLIRGSESDFYSFNFSDGCTNINLSPYNVQQVESDFPDQTYLEFSVSGANDMVSAYEGWPAYDLDRITLTRNINYRFNNAKFERNWYEVGYSYTNDPSTAVWEDFGTNETNVAITKHSSYKYKDYIANGNGSTLGTPYMWLRVKDYPNAVQDYTAPIKIVSYFVSGLTVNQYLDGAKVPLDFLKTTTGLANTCWNYSDLTIKATLRSNPSVVYQATYTGGSHTIPELYVPWRQPFIDDQIYDMQLIMGSGDNQTVISLGYFDFSPGLSRGGPIYTELTDYACVDWGRVRFYLMPIFYHYMSNVNKLQYNTLGWTLETATAGVFPNQIIKIDRTLGSSDKVYLTSADEYGRGTEYISGVPSGTYKWNWVAKPLDAESFGQDIKEAQSSVDFTEKAIPVVTQPYRTNLTSLKRESQSCQDVSFSFDLSEVTSRFENTDGTAWPLTQILLEAIYYNPTTNSWGSVSGIKFTPHNTNRIFAANITGAKVTFTVSQEWPINGVNNVYLIAHPTIAAYSATTISSLNQTIKQNGCFWMSADPVVVDLNALTRVIIDEDRTGGYRCSTGGAATVEVAMSIAADYKVTLYKKGESAIVQQKTVTNTDECVFTGLAADVNSYMVTVDNVTTGGTCAIQSTSYDIYVQTLDNPRLAGYEGGLDCVSNTTSNLILKAASIIKTTYQWYDPDGNLITYANSGAITSPGGAQVGSTANAAYNVIEIPSANIKAGRYKCVVTMDPSTGCSSVDARTPYVSLDGGIPLFWSINAKDSDWNNDENWNDALGQTAYRIPTKCADVYIPSKVNAFHPNLDPSVTTGDALCRDIHFQYGAHVAYTNLLNYDRAFVEYNFGYYGDGVTPTEGQLPSINSYNGTTPYGTITGAPSLARNRWWMLAAPLKEMYSGDFELMGKPYTTKAELKKIPDATDNYSFSRTARFGVLSDNNIALTDKNNALALWMPAYTGATGGSQNILQDSEIQGIIRYPYFDDNAIKTAREIAHSGLTTTFKTYDLLNPATQVATNDVTRTYYNVSKKIYQANRFVYEKVNGSIDTDASGDPVYKMQIAADDDRTDGIVMIGNPFMTPIRFTPLHSANSSKIQPHFWILENDVWTQYTTSSQNEFIAAQQAFAIELISKEKAVEIEFLMNDVLYPWINPTLPRASVVELSKQMWQSLSSISGNVLTQPETLVRFSASGIDLHGNKTRSFISASWEDNNPGTETSVGDFTFIPDAEIDQQAIIYGSDKIFTYPVSIISNGNTATLEFDYVNSKVKELKLTDTLTGEVYNLFDYKNKNGVISLNIEPERDKNSRYQLEINRDK